MTAALLALAFAKALIPFALAAVGAVGWAWWRTRGVA